MQTESWRFEELFAVLDSENKGWIGVFDVERFLSTHTKLGSRASLIADIELMVTAFSKSG